MRLVCTRSWIGRCRFCFGSSGDAGEVGEGDDVDVGGGANAGNCGVCRRRRRRRLNPCRLSPIIRVVVPFVVVVVGAGRVVFCGCAQTPNE